MVERNEHPEYPQSKYRGKTYEALINELNRGNAIEAKRLAQENQSSISEEGWRQIENNADGQFRNLTPKILPKGTLSEKQAEAAVFEAEKRGIDKYGEKNKPGMKDVIELQNELKETEKTLAEIMETIGKAKKEALSSKESKPLGLTIPIVNFLGGIKAYKLKKTLKKLEEQYRKLDANKILDVTLQADNVSPDKGSISFWGGTATAAVGVMAAPASLTVGATAIVTGSVLGLIGFIRKLKNYQEMDATYENLKKLESEVQQAQQQNAISQNNIEMYRNAYRAGAHDNIQRLMN